MIIAGSDQQRLRHDWPSTYIYKRKMDQISIPCCLIRHRIFAVLVLSTKVQSLNSSIPAQASNTLRFNQPHLISPWSYPFADKTPLEHAKFLGSTDLFANIHAATTSGGQTAVPTDLDTDLHSTCFVQAPEASSREAEIVIGDRRLIELDGG